MYELNCLYIFSFHHLDFGFHFKISFSFTHSVPVADPNHIHLTGLGLRLLCLSRHTREERLHHGAGPGYALILARLQQAAVS